MHRLDRFRISIVYVITLFYSLGHSPHIYAEPYLKIQQVRSIDHPYMQVEISLAKITPIDIDTNAFKLFENDWRVNSFQIKKIEPDKDPKHIILVMDSSRSFSLKQFIMHVKAATSFAKALNKNDKLSILSFNDKLERHCGFVSKKVKMIQCIRTIKQHGGKIVLFDALFKGLEIADELKLKRRFIVLFTGGSDEGSVITYNDIVSRLYYLNIPVFIIATGNGSKLRSLARISKISRGDIYYVKDVKNVGKINLLLTEILDNNYMIRYISQSSNIFLGNKSVKLTLKIESKEFNEEDSYTFFIHSFSLSDWWYKFRSDERYFLFGIVSFSILCFLILFVFILRTIRTRSTLVSVRDNKKRKKEEENNEDLEDIEEYITPQEENMTPLAKKPRSMTQYGSKEYLGYLVEKDGPHAGKKYEIYWDNTNIGYADENSIVIDDPLVSYQHAKIKKDESKYKIYDLLSENGTFVNGRKVLRPLYLEDFDEIQLGKTKLIFRKVASP